MGRAQKLFLLGLLLLAVLIGILAWKNRQPPFLPDDAEHRGFVSAEDCLTCHSAEGVYPRGRNHPMGFDCTRCHGTR